jgi:hypothetical protein
MDAIRRKVLAHANDMIDAAIALGVFNSQYLKSVVVPAIVDELAEQIVKTPRRVKR